jgi:hypothetical protein
MACFFAWNGAGPGTPWLKSESQISWTATNTLQLCGSLCTEGFEGQGLQNWQALKHDIRLYLVEQWSSSKK